MTNRQQQDDAYFASTLAEESRLAAKATAQESQATAAAGGIPTGWSYYAPAYSKPERAERRAGVVPAIVGAVVQRGETRGTAVGFERVVCVGGAIGTPEFCESRESMAARSAAIAAIAEATTVRKFITKQIDTGNHYITYNIGEYAIDAAGNAVAFRPIDGNSKGYWTAAI